MGRDSNSVFDEPMFRKQSAADSEHEVWDEVALMPGIRPSDASKTSSGIMLERWRTMSPAASWLTVIGLALVAGPFGIIAAVFNSSSSGFIIAVVVMAPLVEELAKGASALITLERWPYRFVNGMQPIIVCAVSGFVFAAAENLLYLHVYFREHDASLSAWRWTVCVALHVACSSIAGLGLRRMWLDARASLRRPDAAVAASYFITAMVLHGAYNAVVVMLEKTQVLSFGD